MDIKTKDLSVDYDHVVALYKENGYWGAISKSNHVVLRYREPIYASYRELAMTYFHEYILDDGRKMMKSFSRPFDLRKFNKKKWITDEEDLWYIEEALERSPHIQVANSKTAKKYRKADPIERKAGKLTIWKKPSY